MRQYKQKIKKIVLLPVLILLNASSFSLTTLQQMSNDMSKVSSSSNNVKRMASPGSSESDFDFLYGCTKVHHKKLKTRLNNCNEWIEFDGAYKIEKCLAGLGNIETHYIPGEDGKQTEGMAVRLFDPSSKLWSIYWADSTKGTLDPPVTGSFENKTGDFYGRDEYNGVPVLLHFNWDATDPASPVWKQAFSPDDGKTWEWNWFMYFSREDTPLIKVNGNDNAKGIDWVNVLELRNYVLKPGKRDSFINYFEENFVTSQNELGGYPLGQFRVKGEENNFFWIRAFADMQARSHFLPAFYRGPVWKRLGPKANLMIVNNDNVYLLKPLYLENGQLVTGKPVPAGKLRTNKGIAVIDFYISNTKLDKLVTFFSKTYLPVLKNNAVDDYSLWVSELTENDFPWLPVFQDKNLLVAITFYNNEKEYKAKQKQVMESLTEQEKTDLLDLVTVKNSLIIYPTKKTLNNNQ